LSPYLLASVAVLVMAAARWLLNPVLGEQLPFITFFPALFLAAWSGGLVPALFATAASTLLALLLFIPAMYSLEPTGLLGTIGVALFILVV
jgi:K+-sensing histidine kinase KdpD